MADSNARLAAAEISCDSFAPQSFDPDLLAPPRRRLPVSWRGAGVIDRALPEQVDVAIVGGGLIGCFAALQIRRSLPRLKVAILEPGPYLCGAFFARAAANGQRVMRSPHGHQLAPDGTLQLLDFARLHAPRLNSAELEQLRLASAGQRSVVALDLFAAHVAHTLAVHQASAFSYRFRLVRFAGDHSGRWMLLGSRGERLRADAVIHATGSASQRTTPFDYTVDPLIISAYQSRPTFRPGERVAIVGSGLTAGHVLSRAVAARARPVWIIREEERYRCADVDTAFFRQEGQARFLRLRRSARLTFLAEMLRGSLMPEMSQLLAEWEANEAVEVHRSSEVRGIARSRDRVTLKIAGKPEVRADRAILALGMAPRLTTIPADCIEGGYPYIDDASLQLRGHPRCFIIGAASAISIGPGGRNIDGARLAMDRVLPALAELNPRGRKPSQPGQGTTGTAAVRLAPAA